MVEQGSPLWIIDQDSGLPTKRQADASGIGMLESEHRIKDNIATEQWYCVCGTHCEMERPGNAVYSHWKIKTGSPCVWVFGSMLSCPAIYAPDQSKHVWTINDTDWQCPTVPKKNDRLTGLESQ